MTEGTENGRGKESIAYLVAGVASLAALAALGHQAITTVDENRRSGDQALDDMIEANVERIVLLENARVDAAYQRGVSDQTLLQLGAQSADNAARIEAVFKELDSKLQREMALADGTLRAELVALDSRLQNEIAGNRAERHDQLDDLRARLEATELALKAAMGDRWTREDQEEFERQMGLRLRPDGPPATLRP